MNPTQSIIATANSSKEKLDILTFPTHERYETQLCKTGHNFYAFRNDTVKDWNTEYAPLPENYTLFKPNSFDSDIQYDLILSQNKFGQFQIAKQLSHRLHIPIVSLEHTLPAPFWSPEMLKQTQQLNGAINVFISSYSMNAWGYDSSRENLVVEHSVDTGLFSDLMTLLSGKKRDNVILSVNNDFINRDYCLNFRQYKTVTAGLPTKPVGATPGFSEAARSTQELVELYSSSRIFLNTAHWSPIPTALLEAMSCGCAVVSIDSCMIPEYIEHGVNGFLASNDEEMRQCLEILLDDEELASRLGNAARKTIQEKCSEERFIDKWNHIFKEAREKCFV